MIPIREHPFVACKVCGAASQFLCATHNEHGEVSSLSNYRCTDCGLVFIGTELTTKDLATAYESLDAVGYYEETRTETERKLHAARDALITLVPNRHAAIVDIGTGNGAFVSTLSKAGYCNLAAHEIPGGDLDPLRRGGVTVYRDFDFSSMPSESFDAVTMLDVAEHVADPLHLFRQSWRVLKPGGICYLHTPVVSRLDRAMQTLHAAPGLARVGRLWQRTRTSIFHLQLYTRSALRQVLQRSGFASIRIRCRNELSWPLRRYVRVYLCEKGGLPTLLAPVITPMLYPLVSTHLLHANKAVVSATKPTGDEARESSEMAAANPQAA